MSSNKKWTTMDKFDVYPKYTYEMWDRSLVYVFDRFGVAQTVMLVSQLFARGYNETKLSHISTLIIESVNYFMTYEDCWNMLVPEFYDSVVLIVDKDNDLLVPIVIRT